MKTKTKNKPVQNDNPVAGLTFQPVKRATEIPITNDSSKNHATHTPTKSLLAITNEFFANEKENEKDNGENSVLADAENVFKFICENYKTFCLNDVLAASRHLDTNAESLIPIFQKWTSAIQESGRLKVLRAVYDWPQFTFK